MQTLNFKNIALYTLILLPLSVNAHAKDLQKISFESSDYFPEGGEFYVRSEGKQCLIKGISYSEYGNTSYEYYFKKTTVLRASMIVNKYRNPIYISSKPEIVLRVKYTYKMKNPSNSQILNIFTTLSSQFNSKVKSLCK